VQIETTDNVEPLRELKEVQTVRAIPGAIDAVQAKPSRRWELELHESADPQSILQFCFARGIRLQSFNQSEPTLHEVFMRLVGPEAKEASFR
jgi:ABC-type uncharacterized transport system ATPase subunit